MHSFISQGSARHQDVFWAVSSQCSLHVKPLGWRFLNYLSLNYLGAGSKVYTPPLQAGKEKDYLGRHSWYPKPCIWGRRDGIFYDPLEHIQNIWWCHFSHAPKPQTPSLCQDEGSISATLQTLLILTPCPLSWAPGFVQLQQEAPWLTFLISGAWCLLIPAIHSKTHT